MNHDNLDKWRPIAWQVEFPLDKLPVPSGSIHGEAADIARFLTLYWDPRCGPDGTTRPGLASAVTSGRFGPELRQEILELLDAYQSADLLYRLADVPVPPAPVGDAHALITRIRDTVEWYATDVGDGDALARVHKLAKTHDGAHSHDALALALSNYAALAELYEDEITGILGFDADVIRRTRETSQALLERPGRATDHELREGARQALVLRNRIVTLLYERIQLVRAAARVVFRGQPDILAEVASAYYRERRTARRRKGRGANVEGEADA